MIKIIGSGVMKKFSQELDIEFEIKADDLPVILNMPEPLVNNLIIVRNHRRLGSDEMINPNDEIYLFFAMMGG